MNPNLNPNPSNPLPPTSRKPRRPQEPVLRFSPTAWAKLLFFKDQSDTEIGGFALTDPEDLLYVQDFLTVRQEVSMVSVSLADEAVADLFETQIDAGRRPEQFARVWCHTHPGNSPQPSGTDEDTFNRVFGGCDWALMFILAQQGKTYARLRFNVGPGGQVLIPVQVDYSRPFGAGDLEAWKLEYQAHILTHPWPEARALVKEPTKADKPQECALPADIVEQIAMMEPAERRMVLEELAGLPDLWIEGEEVYL